jgi:hypothetical protein
MPQVAPPEARWPQQPVIHEVFTWPWLTALSQRQGRKVSLASVPPDAWDALALPGADAVWLMGVWRRSERGREIALQESSFRDATAATLPDARDEDVIGSAYCIRAYEVDERLGGEGGLVAAREELARRGLKLVLDWVPNHVAPDHEWVSTHPEYFVHGSAADREREPDGWLETPDGLLAHGRDPYFPPWTDVVQLNPLSQSLRDAVVDTLSHIADRCDGVRCDMAMLFLDDIAARTWGDRLGPVLPEPYWVEVIRRVKTDHPDFLFLAEAYWDLESRLFDEGIDRCYDKRLADRLTADGAESLREHIHADPGWQSRLVRFLENHDEPRSASVFPLPRLNAAAVALLTLPGTILLFEGQTQGRRVRTPVHLARSPSEQPDPQIEELWGRLLPLVADEQLRSGTWRILDVEGWPDNQSCANLLAWRWDDHLVVLNYSDTGAEGRVRLDERVGDRTWTFRDLLDGVSYEWNGDDLDSDGLYVALLPYGAHLFRIERR